MSNHRQMTMPFQLNVKRVWTHGFFIGLVMGALGFAVYYGVATMPLWPPAEENAYLLAKHQIEPILPAVPNNSPPAPGHPVASLETQLAQVLDGIKETNQKKDLDRLLSFYSPNFPQLSEKAHTIKNTWKTYDYQKMAFKIEEIKLGADNTATALVTWEVLAKDLRTRKMKDISKTYRVTFVREASQWQILGLKDAF